MKFPDSVRLAAERLHCEPHPVSILEALRSLEVEGGPVDFEHVACLEPTQIQHGENLSIQPFTVLTGPIFFGNNVRVGPHCFLRGPLYIDDNVTIGCGVEVTRSVLLDGCLVPHKNVLPDCIIGARSNLAGFTVTPNFKFNGKDVRCGDRQIDKMGCVIGNDVKIAVGVFLMPGSIIPDGETVYGPSVVMRNEVREF